VRRRPAVVLGTGLAAAAIVVAGCGSGGGGSSAASGAPTVDVTLVDAGCSPARVKVPAGPVTFHVTNRGAGAVTELEVQSTGSRVLGEVENLADGFSGSFSLTLAPGRYVLSCPGGKDAERGTLLVTGHAAAPAPGAEATRAVSRYRAYVVAQTALLQARTRAFAAAVRAGDVAGARARYAVAREPYERIEPIAESFGALDAAIDARAGDVPAVRWTGFHRIERGLWVAGSTAGLTPLANRLVADTARLRRVAATAPLQPAQVANGAKGLLDEVAASKITGEEDRYSHADLWDFEANVDGAERAFAALRPLVVARDAALARRIDARFADVERTLGRYRRGAGFVTYTALSHADTRALARSIDALAQPISQVPALVNT